jgi:spore coat polysaccharide biosynthesis protein SpsF
VSQAVIILQARMTSTRLPGKVLEPIGARSLLAHCILRLRLESAAPVLLATTTNPEDTCLVEVAANLGVESFRGSEHHVLHRFVHAARYVGARYVVRATADNPAVDIGGPERLLRLLRTTGADYVVEDGLPYGANVEGVTTAALERALDLATDPSDIEHVTPIFRRDRVNFSPQWVPAPAIVRRPELRVTVDTPEDLWFMRQLAARLNNWEAEPSLAQIIRVIDSFAVESQCA